MNSLSAHFSSSPALPSLSVDVNVLFGDGTIEHNFRESFVVSNDRGRDAVSFLELGQRLAIYASEARDAHPDFAGLDLTITTL